MCGIKFKNDDSPSSDCFIDTESGNYKLQNADNT